MRVSDRKGRVGESLSSPYEKSTCQERMSYTPRVPGEDNDKHCLPSRMKSRVGGIRIRSVFSTDPNCFIL